MWYIDDMKRLPVVTVILISLLAVSCTHESEDYVPVDDTASVRYAVQQARKNVSWTAPLEPDALDNEPAGKKDGMYFYPSAGFSSMTGENPVYPTLEDFGSLDTSGMKKAILSGVNDFLKQLSQKTLTFGSSFFDKPYEGVVILYEASMLPEIQSWTIGKPLTGQSSSYEVPVQLVTENGKCTIRIFLNPEKVAADEVCIQQVMFGAVKSEQ